MQRESKYMQEAIDLSRKGIHSNEGGPFGCVIVKGEEIVGRGWNQVTSSNDPTAHAEIVAIREACNRLGSFQLSGCEVYTSCEPCPMCMGAIYWARPMQVFYANSRQDASLIGFDDSFIYEELTCAVDKRKIPMTRVFSETALQIFNEWANKNNKIKY